MDTVQHDAHNSEDTYFDTCGTIPYAKSSIALLCFTFCSTIELLPIEVLIRDGQSVLEASITWKKGKTFGDVKTFSYRVREGQRSVTWHCRVSEHRREDLTFEELWEKLGKNKIVNEQR